MLSYLQCHVIEGAGQDYLSLAGSTEVTFTAGGSNISRCVTFTILDDTVLEGEHEFTVNITDVGSAAAIGDPSVCTVTIVDDEGESREEHYAASKVVPVRGEPSGEGALPYDDAPDHSCGTGS